MADIYLDHNATTPAHPIAIAAMQGVLGKAANPSSTHRAGQAARHTVDNARRQVRTALNAEHAQVIFTASGTEANNLALHGLPQADYLAVSAIEHPSVILPAQQRDAILIPVNDQGIVDITALERILQAHEGKALVSVMLANNETGVIQPIAEIAACVYAHQGFLHCDAVQALGKIPVDFTELNVDMLTISGHKIGAGQGAAALLIKQGLHLRAQLLGGGQESGYRAGTENVAAIAALGAAINALPTADSTLRDNLEQAIAAYAPDAIICSRDTARLPNTSCIILPGMPSETQLINFDLAGIAVSSGSACSSGKVSTSHVLLAMGIPEAIAQGAIRVSLGSDTTQADIDAFLEVWKKNYSKTQTSTYPAHAA